MKGISPNSTGLNLNYDEMAFVHSILQVRLTPRYMSTVNKTAVQEAPDRPVDTQFCLHKSKMYRFLAPTEWHAADLIFNRSFFKSYMIYASYHIFRILMEVEQLSICCSFSCQVDALLDLSLTDVPAETDCKIKTLVESMYSDLGITCVARLGKVNGSQHIQQN